MELRPYQQEAESIILNRMKTQDNLLLQAATGAGKTIIFSDIIKQCRTMYPKMHIGVLAHREQLIRQARDKLLRVWPEGEQEIGIACSSVQNVAELNKPVIIGSPQTLINRIGNLPPIHFLMVDECHRIPPKNIDSQYNKLIERLRQYYPTMRLLGVTATPYRLQTGYIYGKKCKEGTENWFENLDYQISIKTLIDQGFLVGYEIKAQDSPDLSGVKLVGREFNEHQLEQVMIRELHLQSAAHAIRDYAADRQSIVVFCVTIKHAEKLCELFLREGIDATCVHTKLPHDERMERLARFDRGDVRVICNVDVLTEGWDCTRVDCMLLCRPTMSTAKYVQMIGRGLRLHDSKTDCLILDLSGNNERHGDPNDPNVVVPRKTGKTSEPTEHGIFLCPECGMPISPGSVQCEHCGAYLINIINTPLDLKTVISSKTSSRFTKEELLKRGTIVDILDASVQAYTSKRNGNNMVRVSLKCKLVDGGNIPITVYEYWDIEGNNSYGRVKAQQQWLMLSGGEVPPITIQDAVARSGELTFPKQAKVQYNKDGFAHVKQYLR